MMISSLPLIMVYCLVCTEIIECITAFFIGMRCTKHYLIIILVNLMTNPLLVSVTFSVRLMCSNVAYYIVLAVFEIIVVGAEGLVYKQIINCRLSPYLMSLILNCASFFIGAIINKIVF